MSKILGLDLGTNSIGIAVRNPDNGNRIEDQLEFFRSVIFKSGVGTGKTGEFSYAAERTKYRSSRNRYKARKQRLWATLRVLIENGYCPLSIESLNKWSRYDKAKGYKREYPIDDHIFEQWIRLDFNMDGKPDYANPFEIRDELTRREFNLNDVLDRYAFGRAIYHIAQHRGFKSSKGETLKEQMANETADEETPQKKAKKGNQDTEAIEIENDIIGALKKSEEQKSKAITEYMTANNLQTVGQAYCKLIRSGIRVRESEYCAVRSQFKDELKYIFKYQGLDLESKFCKAILSEKKNEGTIFYKRPLRSQKGLVGKCTLEKGKSRCPISHPEYEIFRAFCFINNIKYRQSTDEDWTTLTLEQKQDIFSDVFAKYKSKPYFKFEKIREWIEKNILEHSVTLQYAKGGIGTINYPDSTSVSGCRIYARLKDLLGDNWLTRVIETSHERLNKKTGELHRVKYNYEDVWHLCFMFSTSDEYERLEEVAKNTLKFSDDEISKLKGIFNSIEQGYANLSLKAIRKINVYLTKGYIYSHAVLLAKLPDIFDNKWQDVSSEIGTTIENITSEYAIIRTSYDIARSLISKYKQLPIEQRFAYKDYSYTLDKSDYDDIDKAIYRVLRKSVFLNKPKEYQEQIRTRVAELYQKYFNSTSRAYFQTPTLIEFVSQRLASQYNIKAEVLQKKLYHPSMIEFYQPSTDGLLGSPVIGAIRNPMAMRVLHTLRRQINQLLKKGIIDSDTRIVVETARELNDANWRWAIKTYQSRRDDENKKFAEILSEFYPWKNINDTDIDSTRILLEQSANFINSDAYFITKDNFKKLLQKYRLWLEQGCISIYTGNPIRIADLLNGNYDIEHTIPRSKSFDDSLANKTICEADFNRNKKKDLYPTQLRGVSYKDIPDVYKVIEEKIKPWQEKVKRLEDSIEYYRTQSAHCQDKETKDGYIRQRHLRELELDYWKKKVDSFTTEEFTDSFRNNQLNDTRIITKYAFHYLKSVFEHISVQRGETTAQFRKITGLQSVDEKKDRSLHSHHAIDAAVLTLIPSHDNKKALLDLFYKKEEAEFAHANTQQYEKDLKDKIEECEIPDVKNLVSFIQNNILVEHIVKDQALTPSHKRLRRRGKTVLTKDKKQIWITGDTIRGQLHKETFYGAIKEPIKENGSFVRDDNGKIITSDQLTFVVRSRIDSFEKWADLEKAIVNKDLIAMMKSQFPEGTSLKGACAQGIWMLRKDGTKVNKIRHIRCYAPFSSAIEIKKQTYVSDKLYKQPYYAVSGELPYMCKYCATDTDKDDIFIPYSLFTISSQLKQGGIPQTIQKKDTIYRLTQILKSGDIILVFKDSVDELYALPKVELHKRLYVIDRFEAAGKIYLYHINFTKSAWKEKWKSIDFNNLLPAQKCGMSAFKYLTLGIDFEFDGNEIKFLNQ